jgi:hypothetical protein
MPKTTKHEVIVATWEALNRPTVGAKELRAAQKALGDRFGAPNVISPAAIARVLADEGAALRHPEVIEFDAQWRQSQIEAEAKRFARLSQFSLDEPLMLNEAEALLSELEELRKQFERSSEAAESLQQLRDYAIELRHCAQTRAKDRGCDAATRQTQKEIAEWITVWIQTPALFADWLDLRRRSPEFQRKFRPEQSE